MFQKESTKIESELDKFPNYIQFYAPCNATYTEEEKDKLFDVLAGVMDKISDSEDLIIMGDANGKVSRKTP